MTPGEVSDTAWTDTCPRCGAHIQPVARGCWHCGAERDEPDSQHPDYRPVDPEGLHSVSVAILAALAVILPLFLVLWILSYFW